MLPNTMVINLTDKSTAAQTKTLTEPSSLFPQQGCRVAVGTAGTTRFSSAEVKTWLKITNVLHEP